MSEESWIDALLAEAMRRGALIRWSKDGGAREVETREGSLRVEPRAPEQGPDPFLLGLWAGMTALGPLDVETDYRHVLGVYGRVVVPALAVTPRTIRDLRASAFALNPFGRLAIETTSGGDIKAEVMA